MKLATYLVTVAVYDDHELPTPEAINKSIKDGWSDVVQLNVIQMTSIPPIPKDAFKRDGGRFGE